MKKALLTTTITALTCCVVTAGSSLKDDLKKNNSKTPKIAPKEMLKKHAKDSTKVAGEQDELSADVQDLVQEQTDPKVMELLNAAEDLMGEATELLENKKTGGDTLAIETEIIEKIYEAAKKKQQSSQSSEGSKKKMGSMLEMMEGMMGKKPGEKPGDQPSKEAGEGSEGTTDKASSKIDGTANNTKEERRVPKNTSAASRTLPREEQRAIDAYNKQAKPSKK